MVALTKGEKEMKYTHLTPCRCKSIRIYLEWTRNDLAKAANCSPSTVGDFENYKVIGFDEVLALDEALAETGKVNISSYGFEFKVETHLTPRQCKLIRLYLEWTQKQLAEAAQCSLSTVRNFENCEIIGSDMLLALEGALTETGKVKIHSDGFELKEGN